MIKNILIASILMTVSNAWAQGETPVRKNDKLDIQKLEQKYWAAKDDDFSVVQNRKYTKADRFFLSAAVGSPINDPYNEGTYLGLSAGYFFSERWGLEVSYNQANFKKNDATSEFEQYGTSPDYNKISNTYFLTGTFVPFYAKMSVMDKSIIYFDMGFNLGLGMNNYEIQQKTGALSKSSPALKLGIFQQIFFSEHFAIRADFTNVWSSQTKAPFDPVASTRSERDEVINDSSIMIGLTYWH